MDTRLSSKVTVRDYVDMLYAQDKERIAEFVMERFTERYFDSVRHRNVHGFALMAVACLVIESLESFRQGLPDTRGESKQAFKSFFSNNSNFSFMHKCEVDKFYTNIRCGILHQAETSGGWKIRKNGEIFNPTTKVINAKKFHSEVENSLLAYCEQLRDSEWNDVLWVNFRKKMDAILENCGVKHDQPTQDGQTFKTSVE